MSPFIGVQVEPSGHKSFIVRYRVDVGGRNAARRQIKRTAASGGILTADIARRLANRILGDVAHGKDPASDRDAKRSEMTVSELCDFYVQEGTEIKKASTVAIDKGCIERHIKPLLGSLRISEVASADIEHFMRDVASGKTTTRYAE